MLQALFAPLVHVTVLLGVALAHVWLYSAHGVGGAMQEVLYTDTTDAYRLDRRARVRTDLGGFYFHLIFTLGLVGLYLVTNWEFLLLTVLLIDLSIIYQCIPFVRFDGYWALADLTGIPDFFSQMGRS